MNTISRDDAEELASAVDGKLYEDYSGRSMYDATCFGVVCDVSDVRIGVALAQALCDYDVDALARAARTDSMGHDVIVYFPGWQLEAADEDDK